MTGDVESSQAGPRALTSNERALLNGFLRPEFDGVEALRVQAPSVLASPGCTCGCGTIAFHVPDGTPRSSSRSPLPVEAEVVGAEGEPIGGLLLFLDEDGRLSSLEVYTHLDDPLPLPPASGVRWWTAESGWVRRPTAETPTDGLGSRPVSHGDPFRDR